MLESYKNIFLEIAFEALNNQNIDGSMASGHNGPYFDKESPLRNTSHWIITFKKAFELTGNENFKNAIEQALGYIKKPEWRPANKSFVCRYNDKKDKCNGLIGQAWIIEALISGYEVTEDDGCLKLAVDLFKLHPFSEKDSLWKRVSPNGDILGFDYTFNHQLWFCLAGLLCYTKSNDNVIYNNCYSFMENMTDTLMMSKEGRIMQNTRISFIKDYVKRPLKNLINRKEYRKFVLKEIGYHAFNTFAFARINNLGFMPDNFKEKLKIILNFLNSDEYKTKIYSSKYGFEYNPPGFEVLYTYIEFEKYGIEWDQEFVTNLIKDQFDKTYDPVSETLKNNTFDEATANARLYELSFSL